MDPRYSNESGRGEKIGFFKRIFGLGGNPERKRAIRLLKKELASCKIDLYKFKQDTILAPVAKILFEVYKLTYPLKLVFHLEKSNRGFPPSFVESFMLYFHPDKAAEIYNKLNEEYIKKLITKYGIKKTAAYFDKLLAEYFDCFDRETIRKINGLYANLLSFARFTHFDFFPILREFDPKLEEADFIKKPSFSPAEGSLLRDDFSKLHKALYSFSIDERIDRGMEIFSNIKGIEPINKNNFNRLKKLLSNLQKNNYTALIIRAIDKNPAPIPLQKPQTIDIFNVFSFKRKGEVHAVLNSIKTKMRDNAVRSIVSELFNGSVVGRVKNYNEKKNDQFKNLRLSPFAYTTPLNYVKAFATDNYKTVVSKAVNELIISGIFIHKGILNTLSNSYYALNKITQKIDMLDDDLDIDGASAKNIHKHLVTITKDKNSRNILEKTIKDVNKKAEFIVTEAIVNLKDMASCLKNILDDCRVKSPALVSNIGKIRTVNNKEFIKELVNAYKIIYQFLKLLSNYISISVTRDEYEKQKREIA